MRTLKKMTDNDLIMLSFFEKYDFSEEAFEVYKQFRNIECENKFIKKRYGFYCIYYCYNEKKRFKAFKEKSYPKKVQFAV